MYLHVFYLLICNLLLRATRTPRCAGERTRVVLGLTKHGLQNEIMTESVRRDEKFSCHVFPYSRFTDFCIAGRRVRAWILAAILFVQWFTVIRTVFRSPSVATFLTQNRAGIGRPGQVHGPNARPFSGLKAPHESRSSRREEARSFRTQEVRASLRRLLRFKGSMREVSFRRNLMGDPLPTRDSASLKVASYWCRIN
jgi:hypothetical protein